MINNYNLPPQAVAMCDIINTAHAAGILTKEEAEAKLWQIVEPYYTIELGAERAAQAIELFKNLFKEV